jgi:hypothetical protein
VFVGVGTGVPVGDGVRVLTGVAVGVLVGELVAMGVGVLVGRAVGTLVWVGTAVLFPDPAASETSSTKKSLYLPEAVVPWKERTTF